MFALEGLQSRCGSVFSLLAVAACPDSSSGDRGESPGKRRLGRPRGVLRLLQKQHKLHTSHALSMDVLLGRGLELGSHSPDCWSHVFRSVAVLYLKQKLESVKWFAVDWQKFS
jgi:brefeldin A-inhibited guanine nucleotide-exchange protein 3